jgi:hypothetical protein
VSFTVVWRPSAERRLAELWINAPDRHALTAAADAIDSALKRDPYQSANRASPQRDSFSRNHSRSITTYPRMIAW